MRLIDYLNKLNELLYSTKETVGMNIIGNIIQQLPKFDLIIFVPTGCYRYIASFLEEKTTRKIMFWEIHRDRNQKHSNKFLEKKIKGKRCLIIDKSYTGKTLNYLAKSVKRGGGIPIRLALFPKGKLAIKNSEYVLLLDKIMKSDKINLKAQNWCEKIYKEILTKNK